MGNGTENPSNDAFLEDVFNALLLFDGYDEAEAGGVVTVRMDLIETRRRQGQSASDIARYLAAIGADFQAMAAGKGESELLRALREEELNAYVLEEKSRIASVLGLNVADISADAFQHMWEEIPVVIRSLRDAKPWLTAQSGAREQPVS